MSARARTILNAVRGRPRSPHGRSAALRRDADALLAGSAAIRPACSPTAWWTPSSPASPAPRSPRPPSASPTRASRRRWRAISRRAIARGAGRVQPAAPLQALDWSGSSSHDKRRPRRDPGADRLRALGHRRDRLAGLHSDAETPILANFLPCTTW